MGNPVVHFEIGAADARRARRFYSDLFGWDVQVDESGYAMVGTGSAVGIAGGIMPAPAGRPPWVTFYVSVADLDKALVRVDELGGRRLMGPQPIGEDMAFAMFTDPEGNVVGLVQEPEAARG
jgi:predicted enzyme related to lactoylglutathione lyase